MTRSPMPPDAAEWVRDHVWTAAMRRTYRTVPGLTSRCACECGPSSHCTNGRHDQCGRATPLPSVETFICGPDGETVACFAEPYEHPTPTATGPRRTYAAQVWLADRVCAWRCPCDCHAAPVTPGPVQLDLLAVV